MKKITLPLSEEEIAELKAGDSVLASGVVYTARDCAHKRIMEYLDRGEPLPFPLVGSVIYYAGPCPAPEGKACGSCGPTTSARMNTFAPRLLDAGLGGMIGKGEMSEEVERALVRNRKAYFAAVGGAGAIYGNAVQKCDCVAFPDLLSEAVYRMEIEDFPLVVAVDSKGDSVYRRTV
ncbi:MAG: FumA C-terminus/TtdB family hydratase beta subunit [Candidatus Gallimonas sp.]